LIVAIGPQNAFVLRQGIRREHVLSIVVICALSDALLVAAGIGGIGAVLRVWPIVIQVIRWLGAGFLLCYGLLAGRRCVRSSYLEVDAGGAARSSGAAIATCAALTWLNPHVYLDTVLLLGSVASGYGARRWLFWAGAALASVCWFSALGFGARLLGGLFSRPLAWRVLDGVVAATMLVLGVLMITTAG